MVATLNKKLHQKIMKVDMFKSTYLESAESEEDNEEELKWKDVALKNLLNRNKTTTV
jgi:hypothetical protein